MILRAFVWLYRQFRELFDWNYASEEWSFQVADRPGAANTWKQTLPDGQRVDSTALVFPPDDRITVSFWHNNIAVGHERCFLPMFSSIMAFYGTAKMLGGEVYIVGSYGLTGFNLIFRFLLTGLIVLACFLGPTVFLVIDWGMGGGEFVSLENSTDNSYAHFPTLIQFYLFGVGAILVLKIIKMFRGLMEIPLEKRMKDFLSDVTI